MKTDLSYKHLAETEEKEFKKYFESKIPKIKHLVTKFADDAVLLKASIEKFEKHKAYEVELRLHLPSKELIAKETSHEINKSTDLAKDKLIAQIKKHIEQLQDKRNKESIRD